MASSKKTLVMGASENPSRYSYLALQLLRQYGHPVVALGRKAAVVKDVEILTAPPGLDDIDTVTLYLNPLHQEPYYDYVISLRPRRVIFNPGTENESFQERLEQEKIPYMEACTLVMLRTGQY